MRLIHILAFVVVFAKILEYVFGHNGYCLPFHSTFDWDPPLPRLHCYNYTSLPTGIEKGEDFKVLDLSSKNNTLEVLVKDELLKTKLENLLVLDLGFCEIRKIERGAFRGGNKVNRLSLNDNKIKELDPKVFSDLGNLDQLNLSGNPIREFTNEFPRLTVTNLDLKNCEIQFIHPKLFENLEELNILELKGNRMTELDWKVFRKVNRLEFVSLNNNPFKCDCHIRLLRNFLNKRDIHWNDDLDNPVTCSFNDPSEEFYKVAGVNYRSLTCFPVITSIKIRDLKEEPDGKFVFSLECDYNGYPKPDVFWEKDGHDLDTGWGRSVVEPERLNILDESSFNYEFRQICEQTFNHGLAKAKGTYKCIASNSVGSTSRSFYVGAVDLQNLLKTRVRNSSEKEEDNSAGLYVIAGVAVFVGILIIVGIVQIVAGFVILKRRNRLPEYIYRLIPPRAARAPPAPAVPLPEGDKKSNSTNSGERMELDLIYDCISNGTGVDENIYETPICHWARKSLPASLPRDFSPIVEQPGGEGEIEKVAKVTEEEYYGSF